MTEVTPADPVRKALGRGRSKRSNAQSPREKEVIATKSAYARLFATRDGKVVLEDLKAQFYDNVISDSDTSRDVGKRDVLLYINQRVTQ